MHTRFTDVLRAALLAALVTMAVACAYPGGSPAPSEPGRTDVPGSSDPAMPTFNPTSGSPNPSIMVPPPIY